MGDQMIAFNSKQISSLDWNVFYHSSKLEPWSVSFVATCDAVAMLSRRLEYAKWLTPSLQRIGELWDFKCSFGDGNYPCNCSAIEFVPEFVTKPSFSHKTAVNGSTQCTKTWT